MVDSGFLQQSLQRGERIVRRTTATRRADIGITAISLDLLLVLVIVAINAE